MTELVERLAVEKLREDELDERYGDEALKAP
jgi:hypothetical protein